MSLLNTRRIICCLAVAAASVVPTSALAQAQTQRGAALGGLAGAVAGGLIGDNNGEAGAGAAIGGVVGAITGGILGNATEKENVARQQQQFYYQQQQAATIQSAVSISDAISMTRSGLSDSVIINQINQRGVQQTLQVPDIITLHQQGVREPVISALQQAPVGAARVVAPQTRVARAPAPVIVAPVIAAPVVVQKRYVVPLYAPPQRNHHRRPSRQAGVRIRF